MSPFLLVAGGFAAVLGFLLLTLPTLRVLQGTLPAGKAVGLWISGVGFGLLAGAAFLLTGPSSANAILLGVVLAVLGNVVQRA